MYELQIGTDTYNLDGDWTVKQWQELMKLDVKSEFLWPKLLSQATGAPLELCADIPLETLEVGVALVGSLLQPSWQTPKKRYLRGELKDYSKFTIGDFIDAEVAVGRGLDKWIHLLIGTLYGVEPESVWNWKIQDVYPVVHNYLNWRIDIYKQYEALFDLNEGGEDDGPKTDPAYAWYDLLMMLADEKFLNIEAATQRPIFEALNYMAWRKDQAKKEELERKKLKI